MWCVHLNLSWQAETILTRSKLSKMHLLLDPLQVRRSTTGTWYSPHQTYFGMAVLPEWCFYVQNQVKWWAKPLWFPTLCTLFWGKAHWDATKKAPSAWTSWLKSRWDNWGPWSRLASLSIYESCRQTRTMTPDSQTNSMWILVMLFVDDVSITLFCIFLMLEEGEWRRTSIVWRLPSS